MTQRESNFIKASVREFTTTSGKVGHNIDINVADLARLPQDRHGYVRLTMRPRKEKGKYGDTHFLVENDFVPEKKADEQDVSGIPDKGVRNDDLPF